MVEENLKSDIFNMQKTLKIMDEITSMQSIEQTLHEIVQYLHESLKCQTCAIIGINPKNEYLEIVNSIGLSWKFCKQYRNTIASEQIRNLIWGQKNIFIIDKNENESLSAELKLENDYTSCIAMGLMACRKPLGYLFIDFDQKTTFSSEIQSFLSFYSIIISFALLKDHLLNDVQQMNIHDEDTGTYKYSYFYRNLQNTFSRAQRLNENLALILFDIVKFDTIISSYGIKAGNEVVQNLSTILKKHIRKYDCLGRFGADEFIVSLPGSSGEEALAYAQNIYQLIRQKKCTRHKLSIDVSIGIANFPINAKDLSGLLIATKNALIDAKRDLSKNIILSKGFFSLND